MSKPSHLNSTLLICVTPPEASLTIDLQHVNEVSCIEELRKLLNEYAEVLEEGEELVNLNCAQECSSVAELFRYMGFTVEKSSEGDVLHVEVSNNPVWRAYFEGVFQHLARHIANRSRVSYTFRGTKWRYFFRDGKMLVQESVSAFADDKIEGKVRNLRYIFEKGQSVKISFEGDTPSQRMFNGIEMVNAMFQDDVPLNKELVQDILFKFSVKK